VQIILGPDGLERGHELRNVCPVLVRPGTDKGVIAKKGAERRNAFVHEPVSKRRDIPVCPISSFDMDFGICLAGDKPG
jgi:hypothetical protein